jgi:ABC-type branched-subunit amino acid transport system substrate-binding protein
VLENENMKSIAISMLLLVGIVLGACVPKTDVATTPAEIGPGEALFSEAESLYRAGSYQKALDVYNAYLWEFPGGALTGRVLLKKGAAQTALGKHSEGRDLYQKVISEYPESSLASDAVVGILTIYHNEGQYEKVIQQAAEFLKTADSRVHIFRTYVLLGDTYLAMGSPIDAVTYYTLAYKKSKAAEKEGLIVRLTEAVEQLDSEEILYLLDRTDDGFPTGYLLYQLGMNHSEKEDYEAAVTVLTAFVENFPRHEKNQKARNLLEAISTKSVYSHYTVGCLLPFSGRYKPFGTRALKGVELALSRFSSQNDHPSIKIIFKDTGSDPTKSGEAVKELFNDNVAAIIGPLVTAETAAAEAQNSGIPIITLTQKEGIHQIGNYVFRNFFTPEMQVRTLVSFAVETLGLDSFAILYPDENYGTTFMNLFWDEVLAHGGKIVGVESYNSTHTDFADPIKKLVGLYYEMSEELKAELEAIDTAENNETPLEYFDDVNPLFAYELTENDIGAESEEDIDQAENEEEIAEIDEEEEEEDPEPIVDFDAVFIPDAPTKAGLIIPQLTFYDVRDTYLLGTNLWHAESLIEMSRQYAQGAIMTDGFFAESALPHVREFVKDFLMTYGEQPGFIEAVAYDSAMILFEMISRPGVRFRSTLKKELMQLSNYDGVTGLTSFDSEGDVRKKLYLLQIVGKKFVELEHY